MNNFAIFLLLSGLSVLFVPISLYARWKAGWFKENGKSISANRFKQDTLVLTGVTILIWGILFLS